MNKLIIPVLGAGLFLAGCNTIHEESLKVSSPVHNHKVNTKIEDRLKEKAHKHNVPYKLAHSIVYHESKFNHKAIGRGTYGLGQLKCPTAKSLGFSGPCKNLLDIDTNLEYSMRYLRKALDAANNNECYAATLYNRGIGNKPKSSTYCRKILAKYK
jgi:soluble lytic murein transglycosylase-like protein